MAIFGPKPWVNPFGKISIFRLFKLLVLIAQKGYIVFFRQYRPEKYPLRYSRTKNVFLGYKNKKFIKSKNRHFCKGFFQGFGPKMAIFPTFVFQAIQARKISFTIFSNEKTPFQAIKKRSSYSRKIVIFPQGLTDGFGPKMAIFPTFSFRQYSPGKCPLRYSRTKKRPSRL